jgi:hypothetical protein
VRAFVRLRHITIEPAESKRAVEALREQTEERLAIVDLLFKFRSIYYDGYRLRAKNKKM